MRFFGPDGKELPPKTLDKALDWLAGLPKTPLVLGAGVLISAIGYGGAQVERFYLQPRREAAEAREQAIREDRYFPPRARLIFSGKTCVLTNEDLRPILEATIIWKAYHVDLGMNFVPLQFFQGHTRPAAEARELKPREMLQTPANDDLGARACKDRLREDACPSKNCPITIIECEARFARDTDHQAFRLSEEGYFDDACRSHALGEARDMSRVPEGWKDPRVATAIGLVRIVRDDPMRKRLDELAAEMGKRPELVPRQ